MNKVLFETGVAGFADEILDLVARKPGLTETDFADYFYGRGRFQQHVHAACRRLVEQGRLERHGNGRAGDPFTYHPTGSEH